MLDLRGVCTTTPNTPIHPPCRPLTDSILCANREQTTGGADVVRVLTKLRAMHADGANQNFGIDGETGKITDMDTETGVWDPFEVKVQTIASGA